MSILNLIIYLFTTYLINNFFFNYNKLLKNNTGRLHQLFTNSFAPLSGGIILLLPVIFIFAEYGKIFITTYCSIFLIGLLSDLNIVSSSKKRFFFQFLIIFLFVYLTKTEVLPTRINFIDNYLNNFFLSYMLTTFSLLILINGSNFIDGLNGLTTTYFLIIIFYILKFDLISYSNFEIEEIIYLAILLIFLLFLNFNNKSFLGDGGSYSLGFLIGFILIKIYNFNNIISPYYIILLLWYPCFENLFSICRKKIFGLSPLKPDNYHFHHYVFLFFKLKLNFNDLFANNLSSISINVYNFIIFYYASLNFYSSKFQILLLATNLTLYIIIYIFLRKLLNNK